MLSRYDRSAILFQIWNIIRDDLPSGLGINGAIAVCDDVPHGFDLPPGNRWMCFPEIITQLSHQLANLQNAQCVGIPVNGVCRKYCIIATKAGHGLFNLLTVGNNML